MDIEALKALTLKLAFVATLHELAKRTQDPIAQVDEMESRILTAIKNATPYAEASADAYLRTIQAQTAILNQACADVRRTFGGR